MKSISRRPKSTSLELLEPRCLLSSTPFPLPHHGIHPLIVAGSPTGSPVDSPALRVDPNLTTSPFAGVGSLTMVNKKGSGSCTATPIADRFILTAAHCVDLNDDGRVTKRDGLLSVTFNLNYGSDLSHQILVQEIHTHPDYTGFNNPSVNDDLAILTLSSPLPAGVPIYPIYTGAMIHTIIMVGYGWSGDGVSGFTIPAGITVKRTGENSPDSLGPQDELFRAPAFEVFTYDFDGPVGNGPLGGPTLGNALEATAGPGDSGGPSFVLIGGDPTDPASYAIAGVNTFTMDNGAIHTPFFGSMAGGIVVASYDSWIQAVLAGKKFIPGNSGGGLGGSGGSVGRGGTGGRPPGLFHTPGRFFQRFEARTPIATECTEVRNNEFELPLAKSHESAIQVGSSSPIKPLSQPSPQLSTRFADAFDFVLRHTRAIDHTSALDELPDALPGF